MNNKNNKIENRNNKLQDFKNFLNKHKGEKHIIIQTGNPDPDSISCALAHQFIAKQYNIDCDIVYENTISHEQNLALVNLLNIDMIRYSNSIDFKKYSHSIFVDNQATSQILIEKLKDSKIEFGSIIDHHEPQNIINPEFTDIQKVGACATLYIEYIENGIIEANKIKNNSEFEKIATALLLGLRSDTENFLKSTERDYRAGGCISKYADLTLLNEILNIKKSKQAMEIIKKALENKKIIENYSIAGVGFLSFKDRDNIPIGADFLLNEENVHTSIVYGIIIKEDNKEYINGSFRTCNLTLNADKFIKECFGKDNNGNFYGGGKCKMGAFEIPISFLSGCISDTTNSEFMKLKWEVYNQKITDCLLKQIGLTFDENNKID